MFVRSDWRPSENGFQTASITLTGCFLRQQNTHQNDIDIVVASTYLFFVQESAFRQFVQIFGGTGAGNFQRFHQEIDFCVGMIEQMVYRQDRIGCLKTRFGRIANWDCSPLHSLLLSVRQNSFFYQIVRHFIIVFYRIELIQITAGF